jgi:hypothetical protein
MRHVISLILLVSSLFRVETAYTGEPEWLLWGDPHAISYDSNHHEWINRNPSIEQWRLYDSNTSRSLTQTERIPEKRVIRISLRKLLYLWEKNTPLPDRLLLAGAITARPTRRIVLINVEETLNERMAGQPAYRCWPHLGLLFIGTVAENEGYEVFLHDELVQGYVNLPSLVHPGDIVGLSLVTTGLERGIRLARLAKELGASTVIAGNDAATFRASQIMGIPDRPIDAVFTSNDLSAVRTFLKTGIAQGIRGVVVSSTYVNRNNEPSTLSDERSRKTCERNDPFIIPRLSLFDDTYWKTVWENYRITLGHKHANPKNIRNATGLVAQGCTKAGSGNACLYCTIADVADIRMPDERYLRKTIETYEQFGINHLFCTTDSLYEMRTVAKTLGKLGTHFSEGMTMYARSWGIAHHPQLLDEWLSLTDGRLLLNVGMDSGDKKMLAAIGKKENRFGENRLAVENIAKHGVHLHYSLIFGCPGETRESCEKTLSFFEWTRATLGEQLDQCEPDTFWLNHGSAAGKVFHDYDYAKSLAAMAGNTIGPSEWERRFHRHKDTLTIPFECIESWYECFTSITVEEAYRYRDTVVSAMSLHRGTAPGRSFAF